MVYSIINRHIFQLKRIYAFKARDVVAVLCGVGTALMMGVDATGATEEMFRRLSVELVKCEVVRTCNYFQIVQCYRGNNRSSPSAHRAVASSRIIDAVWQCQFKFNLTAVTCRFVNRLCFQFIHLHRPYSLGEDL